MSQYAREEMCPEPSEMVKVMVKKDWNEKASSNQKRKVEELIAAE